MWGVYLHVVNIYLPNTNFIFYTSIHKPNTNIEHQKTTNIFPSVGFQIYFLQFTPK